GVSDHHAVLRHGFNGTACGNRFRPALRRRQILTNRDKTKRESRAHHTFARNAKRHCTRHPGMADALFQKHRGDGTRGDVAQDVDRRPHINPHAALRPSRSSRRRRYATKGTASKTIQSFPTICPGRNSREPKASQRNTIESTISPTMLDVTTAVTNLRRASGVYTAKSANSDSRNAMAEANTSDGGARPAEIAAPATIAPTPNSTPRRRCTRS